MTIAVRRPFVFDQGMRASRKEPITLVTSSAERWADSGKLKMCRLTRVAWGTCSG